MTIYVQALSPMRRCRTSRQVSRIIRSFTSSNDSGWQVKSPIPTTYSSHPQSKLFNLPKNIILVRHGESMGNQDQSLYTSIPDWKIPLSPEGRLQSQRAGRKISDWIGNSQDPVLFYVSPYLRTKQTLQELRLPNPVLFTREEPRLREQDFGNFQDARRIRLAKAERPKFGRFFFRFPDGGESGADVFDRVSAFTGTFFRDMEALDNEHTQNATAVFVTHGITARLFVMKWFHWSVDDFEELHNPPNCGLLHLIRTDKGYALTEESRMLIRGPLPHDHETGTGRGLQLGEVLKARRRERQDVGLSSEERAEFDSIIAASGSAWGT